MKPKENIIIPKNQNAEKPLSSKWEKRLDDYNNYTKEYIEHYQKALQGNTASLSIYPYMKARSEALYEQLYYAGQQSLLTEKQIQLITRIYNQKIKTCLNPK